MGLDKIGEKRRRRREGRKRRGRGGVTHGW
jgi:hypothetical protein